MATYQGDYQNGNQHGRGVVTTLDGYRYEGDFVDGKRLGRGIETLSDG